MDGGEVEHIMRGAGLVDLQTRVINVEIGDWGPGIALRGCLLIGFRSRTACYRSQMCQSLV
jgi:hypothetical protein